MSTIGSTSSATETTSIAQSLTGAEVSRDQFLTLLVSQLKAQDPFEPLKNEEFLSQLATFTQLEEQQKTSGLLGNLVALQSAQLALGGLAQGASLVGKHVEYLDAESGAQVEGTVQSVFFDPEGVLVEIDGRMVPAGNIVSVSAAAPPSPSPSGTGSGAGTGSSNTNAGNSGNGTGSSANGTSDVLAS